MKCGRGMPALSTQICGSCARGRDLLDHAAHRVAQALDGFDGEADVQQFVPKSAAAA
jgi:hypothetical protein